MELKTIVNETGLEVLKAQTLIEKFSNLWKVGEEWKTKAAALVVKDETDIATMQMARTGRLFLREHRLEIERTRKEMKENALKEGQAIDKVAKTLKELIEPIEADLHEKERYAEIQAEKRMEALRIERTKECAGLEAYIPQNLNLGHLYPADYERLRDKAIGQRDEAMAEAKAIEDARIAEQKAATQKAIELEKKLVEQRKKQAEEKAKADEALQKEKARAEKEKSELLAKAKKDAEIKQAAFDKAEEERKAEADTYQQALQEAQQAQEALKAEQDAIQAKAKQAFIDAENAARERLKAKGETDKESVMNYGTLILEIQLPKVSTKAAEEVITKIEILRERFINYINEKANSL